MLPPLDKTKKPDFYSIVGVNKDAKSEEIKSAYRKKVKKVHPDTNKSENAAEEFSNLLNAYQTLADPDKKLAYDIESNFDTEEFAKDEPACCSMCKTKSHNLRFVIFKEVTRNKFKAVPKLIKDSYCLKCANIVAIKASMRTWLSGFWLFPIGTILSISALLNNIKGGKKPRKMNARLLINHARYLIDIKEKSKAKFVAKEALKFTKVPSQVRTIKVILESLENVDEEKEKWSKWNQSFFLQIAPFIMFFVLFAVMFYFYKTPNKAYDRTVSNVVEQESLKVIELPNDPLDENLMYLVEYDDVNVHQGPSINFGIINTFAKGTKVRVTALVPGTLWVKITSGNVEGFVISEFLTKLSKD